MAKVGASSHVIAFLVIQIIVIALFFVFVRYQPSSSVRSSAKVGEALEVGVGESGNVEKKEYQAVVEAKKQKVATYAMFQDVHVMIFIGFGFLMTFLKRYGLSAVSLNMLLSAVAIEVFTLVYGFFHLHHTEGGMPFIGIDLGTMLSADFAAAAVLISFGVVLGVASPLQLLVMTVLEITLFVINEKIGRDYVGAVDAGDTIFVHIFGAYFGLTVARVLARPDIAKSTLEGTTATSDLFSMVGTVFLWMFWPSFNAGAAAEGDAQMRAIVNTYYSLCSCAITTFAVSALLSPQKKFAMEHLQNATLAGGVAVGACADMMLTPGGAVLVGAIAAVLSVCGFSFVQPFLNEKLRIHDSCGVNNLHGMPGLLGGLLSIMMAGLATESAYGHSSSLYEIFPQLDPIKGGTAAGQALSQFLAILVTLGFAVVGGVITGLIMHQVDKLDPLAAPELFNDERNIDNMMDKEEGLPEELVALMEDMKSAQKKANLEENGKESLSLLTQ